MTVIETSRVGIYDYLISAGMDKIESANSWLGVQQVVYHQSSSSSA